MAFEDFSHISERRKAERKQKLIKRITIAVISVVVLLVLAAAGIFVVSKSGYQSTVTGTNKTPQPPAPTKEISHSEKFVKTICNFTDYKVRCQNTLVKAVHSKPALSKPKDLLKIAVSATADGIQKAFDQVSAFKYKNPEEKAAFEDCKVLFHDAKEEIDEAISRLGDHDELRKLTSGTPELNNWLSAVMSYQQTCIDGFAKGKLRSDMEKALKASKELTSNSLALVSELVSFFSAFQVPGVSRHLLEKESSAPSLDEDGLPTWMTREDRRMLKANDEKQTPDVVVAKDGSGKFKTISEALAAMPKERKGRYIIFVKEGIYEEYVTVDKKMVNVTMYGDGSQKTVVTGNKNFVDGVRTFQTATFVALGEGFMAKAMGFRNTAGPEKHQAVAIRVQSDRSIFVNCRFEGYQDTLYAQTHRQFYRSCMILGTIDFIFGDAAAIFQNCQIMVRKPLDNQQNIVTAQGRTDRHETTGMVLQNCRIMPDKTLEPVKAKVRTYLGRPWQNFSRTIVMESEIGDLIHPDGWLPWDEDQTRLKTLYYVEFNNRGPGSKVTARVKWQGYKRIIQKTEAMTYTVGAFLQGDWIQASGVPVHNGLFY